MVSKMIEVGIGGFPGKRARTEDGRGGIKAIAEGFEYL